MEQDEIYEDTWKDKESEWLPYLKNDVLTTGFSYARYTLGLEELTVFGMKICLNLRSLANKHFKSLDDENDEPICTYNDEFMRHFVRQSIKGVRGAALNQFYKSSIPNEMFNIMSQELNINGKIFEILDKKFEYTNKHRKTIDNENDSQFDDYRDINQGKGNNYINDKLSKLPIHKKLQKLNLKDVMMDFDITSLYPSAMSDRKSVYLKIESGFTLKPHISKTFVNASNDQTFNQHGNDSAISETK